MSKLTHKQHGKDFAVISGFDDKGFNSLYLPNKTAAELIHRWNSHDALLETLEELVAIVEDIIIGDYHPDSFTLQPAKAAIAEDKKT